jgi:membrane protein DedA with SNARE-associated domain
MSLYAVVSESKVDGRYRLLMPRPLANAAKHFKRRQTNRALFVCHFVSGARAYTSFDAQL